MGDRYKKKFVLPGMLYAETAPVIISGGALLEDSSTNKLLLQLKFKSIYEKTIKSLRVKIVPFAESKEKLSPLEYNYASLEAKRDSEFGQKSAIVMQDESAASFDVTVMEVVFADDSRWDGTGTDWLKLNAMRRLEDALGDAETANEYAIRYGNDCVYFPEEQRDLWYCACGAVNRRGEDKCHSCRRVFSALKNVNFAALKSDSAQRVEVEKIEDEEERAKKSAKRKTLLISLLISVPLIIIIVAAVCTAQRSAQLQKNYDLAMALLGNGRYDDAAAAFAELGDYNNSTEIAEKEVPYEKAMNVIDCAVREDTAGLALVGLKRSDVPDDETVSITLYREAIPLFEALGNYKDSAAQAENAQKQIDDYFTALKEASYSAAMELYESGSYLAARDAFAAMGDYSDCAELVQRAMYDRAMRLYELTGQYYMLGVYAHFSDTAGEKSIIYIPQDVYADFGSSLTDDIRSILNTDGVEVNIKDVPEEGYTPICEAVSQEFKKLGSYKDSSEMVQKALENADFTRPFYELCANGDLQSAYEWLEKYSEELENRDAFYALLTKYIPYCATWAFYSGDSTLVAQSVGLDMKCDSITSKVCITTDSITLVLYPNGDEMHPIELKAETNGFIYSFDSSTSFYSCISNIGHLTYTKYNSYNVQVGNQSVEYRKVS